MKIRTKYQGGNDPFEGDRILWLRSLPSGANITAATVTLIPANAPQFEETVTFPSNQLSPALWGISKTKANQFIEIDFHARRTLAGVQGTNLTNTNLQVDLGGAYVEISDKGTIKSPGDTPFSLEAEGKLPGLTVNKFKLTKDSETAGELDISTVIIRSVPTNVSVRLGQLPPFWTRLGELATSDTSPNFATVFNAFLTTAQQQDGFYQIPLIVHSDTIARLDVEIIIEFFIEQRVLPSHLSEVKLAYGYSTLPSVDESLTTVTLPKQAQAIATRSTAKIIGEFNPTRVAFGPIGEDPTSIPSVNTEINVIVSPAQQLAQPLNPGKEIAVTGIDVPLGKIEPGLAGLNLSIQSDADGKPSGQVLASAEVRVDKPLPNQSTWGSATLPTPLRIEANKRYWLILQSQVGQAHWLAIDDTTKDTTGNPGLQSSRDGGLSWRIATVEKAPSPLKALLRLRTVPENFTVPVQLQIGKGSDAVRLRLDDFAPLGRVEFNCDFAKPLSEYLAKTVKADPCGSDNLLINSDFNDPTPDNASRKLFGFNSRRVVATSSSQIAIEGTVDLSRGINLSVERFIVLALNNQPPVRIDCAGKDPARTQLNEIIQAINTAMKAKVASDIRGRLRISFSNNNLSMVGQSSIELYPWCSTQVTGWQGTRGQLFRINLSDEDTSDVLQTGSTSPLMVAAVLANPNVFGNGEQTLLPCFPVVSTRTSTTTATSLSQRFPVVAGCAYLLQINFLVYLATNNSEIEPLSPPHWELVWFDKKGAALRSDRDILEFETRRTSEKPSPWFYEARLSAPPDAVQAELSFVNQFPNSYALILEKVTFTPTSASLRNSYFQQWQGEFNNRLPAGWQILGGWVDEQSTQQRGAKLRGDGPEDAVLVQTAEVVAGERYELQVNSRLLSASNSDETRPLQQRSRLELHWHNNGSIGTPIIIPLHGRDFPTHTWVGIAPDHTTSAEIRIVQPQNQGDLIIESVSLSQAELVSVPLIFLSEAPGELTVSDLRVAYDLPTPPAPPNLPSSSRNPVVPEAKASSSSPVGEQPQTPQTPAVLPPVPQPVTPPLPPPPAPPQPQTPEASEPPDPLTEEMQRLLPLTENQPELSDSLNEVSVISLAQSPVAELAKSLGLQETYDTKPQTLAPEPPVKKIVLDIPKIIVIFPTKMMKKQGRTSLLTLSNTTEDAVAQPLSVGINLSPRFRLLLERSLFFNQEQVLNTAIPKLFKKLRKDLFHWTRKLFSQA